MTCKKYKEIITNLVKSGANYKKIKRTILELFSTKTKIPKDNVNDFS
jgi:hypothetical protein